MGIWSMAAAQRPSVSRRERAAPDGVKIAPISRAKRSAARGVSPLSAQHNIGTRLPNAGDQAIAHFRRVIGIASQFITQHLILKRRYSNRNCRKNYRWDDQEQRIERQSTGNHRQ
jgi:hypothetical protein